MNIDDINTNGGVDTDPHQCNEIFCVWISYFESGCQMIHFSIAIKVRLSVVNRD